MKIQEILNLLKTGSKEDINLAKKKLESLWPSYDERQKREEFVDAFLFELPKFPEIKEERNKIAFISSLKYLFMEASSDENLFKKLSIYVLIIMRHPSGNVRRAMVHVSSYLMMGLKFKKNDFIEDHVDEVLIKKHINMFGEFVDKVRGLINEYHEPRFEKYKYISSLPVGVYKSAHQLFSELLFSNYYKEAYDKYNKNIKKSKNPRKVLSKIKLKYHHENSYEERKKESDLKCAECGKKGIIIGATKNPNPGVDDYICENCAIKSFQKQYGLSTYRVAEARRRRMFDVQYLFFEFIIDKYVKENKLSSFRDISSKDYEFLIASSGSLYNDSIDKSKKIELEEMEDQKDIEKEIKKIISKVYNKDF